MAADSTIVSRWAVGDPEHLAEAFISASHERGRSLGMRLYQQFIAAIAFTNVHNLLQHTTVIDRSVKGKIQNVVLTAKATERLVAAKLPPEDGNGNKSSDDNGSIESHGTTSADRPLEKLELLVHEILETGHSRRSTGSFDEASCGSGLHLPDSIIQSIMSRLDSKSAVAAALTCKQFSGAHRLNRFFELSAPFRAYLETLVDMQDDFSDGSIESEFNLHFPIDGSPACGQDLAAESYSRRMRGALPLMTQLFALLGGGPGTRSLSEFKSSIRGDTQEKPPAPHSLSSPLAFFKRSKAVPIAGIAPLASPTATASATTTTTTTTTGPTSTPTGAATSTVTSGVASAAYSSSGPSSSSGTATSGRATLEAGVQSLAAPSGCCLSNAICDVQELGCVPAGHMHCEGDLVAIAYASGWKQHDPGLSAMVASRSIGSSYDTIETYHCTGLFNFVTRVCADSTNGLVWAAADSGRRVKAFRAPSEPSSAAAGCNRPEGRNDMPLQYTLCTDIDGPPSFHAGVHVAGTRVMCVKGSGALLVWDIADHPAQRAYRPARNLPGLTDDEDDEDHDDEGMDSAYGGCVVLSGPRYGPSRGPSISSSNNSEPFEDRIDFRDTDDPSELEASRGIPPNHVLQLPTPSRRGAPSAASLLAALGGKDHHQELHCTCLLSEPSSSFPSTLVAALTGSIVVSYDLETQRLRHYLYGHLYDVTQIVAPPASWQQPSLFVTSSRAGDVKLWDLRMRGSSAAVTLTTGDTDPLHTVALARAGASAGGCGGGGSGSGGGGSGGGWSSSGGQLGAGLLCFAGGEGEAVWAWDLRGGLARPLYELSTGNTAVQSLVWHEAGNSLIAACESHWEDRMGGCSRRDWKLVPVSGDDAEGADAGPAEGNSGGSAEDVLDDEGADSSYSDEDGDAGAADQGDEDGNGEEDSRREDGNGDGENVKSGGAKRRAAGPQPHPPLLRRLPRRYWPARPKHQPSDFGRFFNMASSCVLRYAFSEQARGAVPVSEPPAFDY